MSQEIDHEYTQDPVCPYCGHKMRDAWELGMDDRDTLTIECGKCDKSFVVEKYVTVNYSTSMPGDDTK